MVIRIWRTQLDESRAGEYLDFARTRSTPMFRSQPGFAGVLFAARPGEREVITFWEDRAAADALESSAEYRRTVAAIETAGFLKGPSVVNVFELEAAVLTRQLTVA